MAHLSRSVATTEFQVETAALQANAAVEGGAIMATPTDKRKMKEILRRTSCITDAVGSTVESVSGFWMKAAADTAKVRAAELVARRARASSVNMDIVSGQATEWANSSPRLGEVVSKAIKMLLQPKGEAPKPLAEKRLVDMLEAWKRTTRPPSDNAVALRKIKSEGAEPSSSSTGVAEFSRSENEAASVVWVSTTPSFESVLNSSPTEDEVAAAVLQLKHEEAAAVLQLKHEMHAER